MKMSGKGQPSKQSFDARARQVVGNVPAMLEDGEEERLSAATR